MINKLYLAMIAYNKGDAKRIQHFTKVHSYAKLIGQEEGLAEQDLFVLEAAALTHDIAIHICEEKYGSCEGKLQEKEGAALAEAMLTELGFVPEVINRVCYLVSHHHTYTNIEGKDYQILVEADFLVNLYEDNKEKPDILTVYQRIFRTEYGKKICKEMFDL